MQRRNRDNFSKLFFLKVRLFVVQIYSNKISHKEHSYVVQYRIFSAVKDTNEDIVFVLGSRNPHASRDFETMKMITKEMTDQPRVSSTRYGFVTYDDKARRRLNLDTSKDILTQLLDLVPWQREGTRMDKGIDEGIEIFKQTGRPNAEKILVVFTNDKTSATNQALDDVRKRAEKEDVKIVVIGLGSRIDIPQIRRMAPDKNDVIFVDVVGDEDEVNRKVKEVADQVTETSRKGECKDT